MAGGSSTPHAPLRRERSSHMVASILPSTLVSDLTITDTPTLGQLQAWWEAMQTDPTRSRVYTDFMPTEFETFLAPVRHGDIRVWMMLVGINIGGVFSLHDGGKDNTGDPYVWLGTYMLPPYRGSCAGYGWPLV